MFRHNGEQRRNWLLRVETGREWSAQFNIKLPDQIYVGLVLRHTMRGERVQIAKRYLLENEAADVEAEVAEYKIQAVSWDMLKKLSEACMESPKSYKCDMRMMSKMQRMFFFEQAKTMFGMIKAAGKHPKMLTGSLKVTCILCKRAGLRGRLIAHKTENCDSRIRNKNVEKARKKAAQQSSKKAGQAFGPKKRKREFSEAAAQLHCDDCAANGRKSWHDPKKCNYAPGGAWHGLKGDQLKEAQRKTYQNSRNANKITSKIISNKTKI